MSENFIPPRIERICCPHLKLDEHGHVDQNVLSVWGARQTEIVPLDLDLTHVLYLCPTCADILRGHYLSEMFQKALTDGISPVMRSLLKRKSE